MKHLQYLLLFVTTMMSITLIGCSTKEAIGLPTERNCPTLVVRCDDEAGQGLCPKRALNVISDVLISHGYSFIVIDMQSGYIRTEWQMTGYKDAVLATRISVKLNFEERSVRICPECQGTGDRCIDIPLITDLLADLRDRLK